MAHRTQGNTHLCLPVYYKGCNKRWIAKWRDTKGEIQKHRSFCLCGVGVCHLPGTWCVHQPGSFLNPILLEFLWRLHHVGVINYWLNFQPLSPLWRMGPGAEITKLLIMTSSFWWPASIQDPTKSHLIRTKNAPIIQKIPRDLESLCQELGSKTKY